MTDLCFSSSAEKPSEETDLSLSGKQPVTGQQSTGIRVGAVVVKAADLSLLTCAVGNFVPFTLQSVALMRMRPDCLNVSQ